MEKEMSREPLKTLKYRSDVVDGESLNHDMGS